VASVQSRNGRHRVKWYVDGRQTYSGWFATKIEAERAKRTVEGRTLLEGEAPVVIDSDTITLAQWWARWEPGRPWRESTRATHDVHWSRHIEPVFGRAALDTITSADVSSFHRRLERQGLAPTTVAGVHRTLSMALQAAVNDGLIARNPARGAKLRRTVKHAPVALDAAMTDKLLETIAETAPGLELYARLIAATGLRRAEAAGLTWSTVDLDAVIIVVDKQLDYSASHQPAWAPTKNSKIRRVPITDTLAGELRAHRATQVTPLTRDGLVFVRDDGTVWPRVTLADAWRRAARLMADGGTPLPAGARGWHTLRHTCASRLLQNGVPPADVAAFIGDTVEVLLTTYTHVIDRDVAEQRIRAALDN
jgi:integrase